MFCRDKTRNCYYAKEKTVGAVDSSYFSDAVLRVKTDKPAVMDENFDRAPGAGRTRNLPADPGPMGTAGDTDTKTALFNQREPLRQPRTAPPFTDNNFSTANDIGAGGRELSTNAS